VSLEGSPESLSWGSLRGGMTWSKYLEVEAENPGDEGVGDLRKSANGPGLAGAIKWEFAGMGVATPSAFASLASLCGDRGDLGGGHCAGSVMIAIEKNNHLRGQIGSDYVQSQPEARMLLLSCTWSQKATTS
jgi:hypothetical protein